jgi:hypothetical protein
LRNKTCTTSFRDFRIPPPLLPTDTLLPSSMHKIWVRSPIERRQIEQMKNLTISMPTQFVLETIKRNKNIILPGKSERGGGGRGGLMTTATPQKGRRSGLRSDLLRSACGVSATKGVAAKLKICAGCQIERYCSVQCQRAAWKKSHKNVCGGH